MLQRVMRQIAESGLEADVTIATGAGKRMSYPASWEVQPVGGRAKTEGHLPRHRPGLPVFGKRETVQFGRGGCCHAE